MEKLKLIIVLIISMVIGFIFGIIEILIKIIRALFYIVDTIFKAFEKLMKDAKDELSKLV